LTKNSYNNILFLLAYLISIYLIINLFVIFICYNLSDLFFGSGGVQWIISILLYTNEMEGIS